jgi:glycosyltransferase involved in cell wall biosynthesis
VTDATILVPTHRHAALLPYAIRSALAQKGVEMELFVVGDGVEDDSRDAVAPFLSDPRVRFFDFPKGERHGERRRHEALRESSAPIVCYLSDDDLLLPDHVAQMQALLRRPISRTTRRSTGLTAVCATARLISVDPSSWSLAQGRVEAG